MKQKYQLIYPDQVVSLEMTIFRLRLKLWALCLLAPVLSFGGVVLHSTHPKLSWLFPPAGVVASVYGLSLLKTLEREQGLLEALPDYCVASRSQRFKEFLAPGNVLASELVGEGAGETFTPQVLNPELIKSLPHILILGPTGSGKSTLVNEVLNNLLGDVVVVDPHAYPGLWGNLMTVTDYSQAAELLVSCVEEMQRRYKLRHQGQLEFEPFNLLIDEFPNIANDPKIKQRYPLDNTTKDSIFHYWFDRWLRESRKVNMRMILLSQGSSVATLNLSGRSELLENLNILRLGKFARKHAKEQKDETLLTWIKNEKRPGMIDDDPLIIPELSSQKIRDRKPISETNLAWISGDNCGDTYHHDTTPITTNHHDRETLERLWNMNPTTNHHNHHHH